MFHTWELLGVAFVLLLFVNNKRGKSNGRIKMCRFRHLARHPVLPSTSKDAQQQMSMKESCVELKLWHEIQVIAKSVSKPTHFHIANHERALGTTTRSWHLHHCSIEASNKSVFPFAVDVGLENQVLTIVRCIVMGTLSVHATDPETYMYTYFHACCYMLYAFLYLLYVC